MPFPQSQTAGLVTGSNITAQSAAYTAKNGDVVLMTTGATVGVVVTLPPVAQGGPVTIRKVDAAGAGTVVVKTSDGSQVDGTAGTTGRTIAGASALGGGTLVSDGTNWWTVF